MRAVAVAYCIAHSKCRGSSRARNRRAHLLAPADANRAAQSAKPHDTILSLGVRLRQNSDGPVSVITRHRKEDMDVDLYCTANVTALFRVDANSVPPGGAIEAWYHALHLLRRYTARLSGEDLHLQAPRCNLVSSGPEYLS